MKYQTIQPIQLPPSITGQNAFKDDQTFAAWSEAVKRQMLAALQKRQKLE